LQHSSQIKKLKHTLYFIILLFASVDIQAQYNLQFVIKDSVTHETIIGASGVIEFTTHGNTSNDKGLLIMQNVPGGKIKLIFSSIGYESVVDSFNVPFSNNLPETILLKPIETELEEVYVTATRQSRSIENVPTRIEAITLEELEENAMMNSSNLGVLLQETTGIQVQQTSQSTGSAYIRIQGLDGRYTQIIRDGFPLYEGFSSGLSILQIPPLDLRQVEVIKGSASTLYGGGAIAGLINLVSKEPAYIPEISLMLNQTHTGGTSVNSFYSKKGHKTGITLYVAANNQVAFDVNKDSLSDLPKTQSINFNPKFFWYINDSSSLSFSLNTAYDKRIGGNINTINKENLDPYFYFEKNSSFRSSGQLLFIKSLQKNRKIICKGSLSIFDREIILPAYHFEGTQYSGFSEASYSHTFGKLDWLNGINLLLDKFDEEKLTNQNSRSYQHITYGYFTQLTWNITKHAIIESGFRADYNNNYRLFALPRISLLIKYNKYLSSRIGGGLGYKLPTIFTDETEKKNFENISQIDDHTLKAERSEGVNFDINYKRRINDELSVNIDQLFFYSRLLNPLILAINNSFNNATGPVDTRGFESSMKWTYNDFSLYLNYTFIDAQLRYNLNQMKPLTPRHNIGMSLLYEKEKKWKIGYELYYTSSQFRSDYTKTPGYWVMGAMAMRTFRKINVFINFENFTDTRQSRFEQMYTPPVSNPHFKDIWAPIEGFVANAGIKLDI
jgi:outer membrane receptor for ferrienterochelin and colicins